jgi:hypothetical protein
LTGDTERELACITVSAGTENPYFVAKKYAVMISMLLSRKSRPQYNVQVDKR